MYFLRYLSIDVLSVFFFKQKTAYELRISDWSSDVCSSDLRDASVMGPIRRWRIAPLISPLTASSFSLLVQREGTRAAARNKGSIERTLETKHNPRIRSGSSIAYRDRQRVAHISARSPHRRSADRKSKPLNSST